MAFFQSASSTIEIHFLKRKESFLAIKSESMNNNYNNTNTTSPLILQCKASNKSVSNNHIHAVLRRSANYQPSVWHYDTIQSLNSEYQNESLMKQSRALLGEVRSMISKVVNHVDQLELVDVLQRLGVDYHFEDEIKNVLDNIYNMDTLNKTKNLYATALEFRLLRQHGYNISADVFNCFLDGTNNFKQFESIDIEGVLSLYEASFHSMKDETTLDDARVFTSKFLKEYVNKNNGDHISLLINHALEYPLHWRVQRWEAHWFIDVYERSHNSCHTLLHFAKLDFNMLQSIFQDELKYSSRWWQKLGLVDKLSFSRDRLVENYFIGLGMNFKPQLGSLRIAIAKANCLVTTIDDIYDVYGTLEELELFTEAIDRWDLNAMENLPSYMKMCFLALHNFVNDIAYETLKENGTIIIPYLRKSWTDLCKSYLIEAKWYHSGYIPKFEEYMDNAWITIGVNVFLVHAYFLLPNPSRNEDLGLGEYPHIIRFSSMLARQANDLASQRGSKSGDVSKAVECYMKEMGVTEEDACEHVKNMIGSTWKMVDKEVRNSTFNPDFLDIALNVARTALFFYQNEDGYTVQDSETKSRILSLILQPIPMVESSEINVGNITSCLDSLQ